MFADGEELSDSQLWKFSVRLLKWEAEYFDILVGTTFNSEHETGYLKFIGWGVCNGGEDNAAGILNGIEPWMLANAFRHVPRSHGQSGSVKPETISN